MSGETIPAGPLRFGRWQSGALNAAGFFVLFYVVSLAFLLTPLGVLFQAGMFFSLPVMALVWLEGSAPSAMALWLAVVMPYPLIGLGLGLLRPLERPLFWQAVRQMAIRLAVTMAILISPSAVLILRSGLH
jgi:hypothetical protein